MGSYFVCNSVFITQYDNITKTKHTTTKQQETNYKTTKLQSKADGQTMAPAGEEEERRRRIEKGEETDEKRDFVCLGLPAAFMESIPLAI